MGYDVEFQRIAVKVDADRVDQDSIFDPHLYISLSYIGDSNLLEPDGSMVKNWYINSADTKSNVIKRIVDISKVTEGGMLKYQTGSTKPENYIKNWRKELNDPLQFDEFIQRYHPTLKRVFPEELNEKQEEEFELFRDELGWDFHERDDGKTVFTENLPKPRDFFLTNYPNMLQIQM